jgi:hypothetical protein
MEGDRADERWLVHRAPARARWRSPHVRRTKGSALIEVLTTARNVLGACRPLSGTTVLRQPATLRRQPQHPRSSAPRQSPSRTVYNSPAGPLEADLATAKLLARTDPNARISSSQPPLLKCCDDRLNPPWIARSSRATIASDGENLATECFGAGYQFYPIGPAHCIAEILMPVGPRMTTNNTGRKNRIIGTVSFGGSAAAFFSASFMRMSRFSCAMTRKLWPSGVP